MHLSSFGLISLNGSVVKLEPGLDFASYQAAMAHYNATLALKAKMIERNRSRALARSLEQSITEPAQPEAVLQQIAEPVHAPPKRLLTASDIIKLFRR